MKLVEGIATIDDVPAFIDELATIGTTHGVAVQAFDARYVAGRRHLEAAVRLARRAMDYDDMIASAPSIEILLYAAGRRQIDRALEMGVGEGETAVVVVIDGADEDGAAAAVEGLIDPEPVLEAKRAPDRIAAFFDVTEAERAATDAPLTDLVVERVALLAIEK